MADGTCGFAGRTAAQSFPIPAFSASNLRGCPRVRCKALCILRCLFCHGAGQPAPDYFLAENIHRPDEIWQNIVMARGWESKDVESQVELLEAKQEKSTSAAKTAEQLRRDQERKDLQLSRIRIVNDLESATHPQHRKSLEAALAHLDKKISEIV